MLNEDLSWDPGSFRDPTGSVFFSGNSVYRSISDKTAPIIEKLFQTSFFQEYMNEGKIIPTSLIPNTYNVPGKYVLQHEKIPFFTYPYEWSFYMLKDAALLTLDILKKCLAEGYILKDGTAWNLTYHRGKMVFFDILSIDKYEEGQVWNGYQQFCNEFLYPLFIKAYKNIDFQQLFKGTLFGIDTNLIRKMFNTKDILKPGVFKHVFVNAILAGNKKVASATLKNRFKLPKSALIGIAGSLIKIIKSLKYDNKHSIWIDYAENNTYTDKDELAKIDFIKEFSNHYPRNSKIVDLGCNTGNYSFLAAKSHDLISCDIDNNCIDNIYRQTTNNTTSITPMVLNLMNPSANSGWDLTERRSIFERMQADAFFSLALIHHICIANNVPLERFIQLLRKIANKGVLEWVDKKDPMSQFLLRNREDIFANYNWESFEKIINKYFNIKKIQPVNNEHRKLCWLEAH